MENTPKAGKLKTYKLRPHQQLILSLRKLSPSDLTKDFLLGKICKKCRNGIYKLRTNKTSGDEFIICSDFGCTSQGDENYIHPALKGNPMNWYLPEEERLKLLKLKQQGDI